MRCLVTGASGHLGSFLVRRLVSEGAEVSALVRPESNLWRLSGVLDQINLLRADLSDSKAIQTAVRAAAPGVVFHLAWYGVTAEHRNDPEQLTRNVTGSLELLQSAALAGCRCWVGVGSQAEYGPVAGLLHEDLPTAPVTAYGVGKLSVGMLSQKLCDLQGIRYIWLRLLAAYGPADDERHMIPSVILQLLEGKSPRLTRGEQKWDYLYVEDAAEALYRAAANPTVQGVFNLGSGEAIPVREIVERIRDQVNQDLPLQFGAIPYRPDQVMRLQADITRLHNATGWLPRISLDEGLKQTVDWYQNRGSHSPFTHLSKAGTR